MIDALFDSISSSLQNQMVGGGVVLLVTGAVLASLRNIPAWLWDVIRRQTVVRVEVMDRDNSFGWISTWLDKHPYSKRARSVTINTDWSQDEARPRFVPAQGTHFFFYKKRLIFMRNRRMEKAQGSGYYEIIELSTIGRSPKILHDILYEAKSMHERPTTEVGVYAAQREHWVRVSLIAPRPISTVIMPEGVVEELQTDIEEFLSSREWYNTRGIPWRRGYLLYGPPGSGKTSLISAMAGELGLNLYILNLASTGLTDDGLTNLLLNVPKGAIILLEDFESVVEGREVKVDGAEAAVTFSGLLNALDGIASRPGLLTFMTTNHPEKLDEALIRPGRVDMKLAIGAPTSDQAKRMFLHFYEGVSEGMADRFAVQAMAKIRSMAELQHVMLLNKTNPEGAIQSLS